jgi:hypothetical protein
MTHPVEFAECPMCLRFGQLAHRQDWTLYVHHDERIVHLVPIAPPAGTARFTECPDCQYGVRPQATARLLRGRITTTPVFRPCPRCRTTSCVPGFVMPA